MNSTPTPRVRSDITPWFGGRYRAQIFVDNHPVDKAFFDTQADAQAWCCEMEDELRHVVRE